MAKLNKDWGGKGHGQQRCGGPICGRKADIAISPATLGACPYPLIEDLSVLCAKYMTAIEMGCE